MPAKEVRGMEIDQERETILVVDDELAIRAIVRVVLEQAGYAVVTANRWRKRPQRL